MYGLHLNDSVPASFFLKDFIKVKDIKGLLPF